MKSFLTRRNARPFALLCALAPVALLGGCGGGSSSPALPTPTAIPGVAVPTTALRLSQGQIAILQLTRNGNALAGTLRVLGYGTSNSTVAPGTYPIAGDFAAPNGFSLSGRAANGSDLSLSGVLPAGNSDGSYSFTFGNVSQSGVLSAQGIVGTTNPFAVNGDLKFSDFTARGPLNQLSDYPFDLAPITPTGTGAFNDSATPAFNNGSFQYSVRRNNAIYQSLHVQGIRTDRTNRRRNVRVTIQLDSIFAARPPLLSVGQTFDLKIPLAANAAYGATVSVAFSNLGNFEYHSIDGTLTIVSLTPEAVNFELKNVKVANFNSFPAPSGNTSAVPNDGQPISSFIVNGQFSSSGLPTLVRDQQ